MEDVLEYVLDGLEAALALERELGVRNIEFDRELLKAAPPEKTVTSPEKKAAPPEKGRPVPPLPPRPPEVRRTSSSGTQTVTPLVFLHDRPLSAKGVEMMAKIITALGRTSENSPIVIAPPVPQAKVVVVLGGLALRKYFPEMRGEPGQWQKTPEGTDVLITYSPEYILRFAEVTLAVERIKKDMWRSLKAVVQRLA